MEVKRTKTPSKPGLSDHSDLFRFLDLYRPLMGWLRQTNVRKQTKVITTYQSDMSTIFQKDFADLLETLKNTRLIRRRPEDRNWLFSTPHHVSDKAHGNPKPSPSNERDLGAIPLFDSSRLPIFDPNETFNSDQVYFLGDLF